MASAVRKVAMYLGLVEDDQDDMYETEAQASQPERQEQAPAPASRTKEPRRAEPRVTATAEGTAPSTVRQLRSTNVTATERAAEQRTPIARPNVVKTPSKPQGEAQMSQPEQHYGEHYRIRTLHPKSYNDARQIGEEFRSGIPVIMNLTEMDDADAKRIVDFSAGLIFALHGRLERVTNKVFLLSPANVDLGDQARAQLHEDGFFNQS